MAREQYHVVPNGDNNQLKIEQSAKYQRIFDTKQEAVRISRGTAHQHEPSLVGVHKGDGKIEEEWTYRGDPYPPAG